MISILLVSVVNSILASKKNAFITQSFKENILDSWSVEADTDPSDQVMGDPTDP